MIERIIVVSPETEISEAITALIVGDKKVLFILDSQNKLLGIFTNGDMRKYFLTGKSLTEPVLKAMNKTPVVFKSISEVIEYREKNTMVVYPIIDDRGILIDVIYEEKCFEHKYKSDLLSEVPLVIMAGGKGERLLPITKIIPKALVPIGERTITERIIDSFSYYGCRNVFLILNYKSDMIKSYFKDLKKNYTLSFNTEEFYYGTCGGLYLLKKKLDKTFILSNCDVLITDDISSAYKEHKESGNAITIICSMNVFTIPYGVISTDDTGNIIEIKEKPQYNNLVNAGVYFIESEILYLINDRENIDMTDFITRVMKEGYKVGVFPISGSSWLDMGEPMKLKQMRKYFENI